MKSVSSVKAAVGVVPFVTAVPPVEPEVVVTLYCSPFTKILAFLLEHYFMMFYLFGPKMDCSYIKIV